MRLRRGDPQFDAWDEYDSMIMTWLWNSMTPEISDTWMLLTTAKDIWDAVHKTYLGTRCNTSVWIKVKIGAAK